MLADGYPRARTTSFPSASRRDIRNLGCIGSHQAQGESGDHERAFFLPRQQSRRSRPSDRGRGIDYARGGQVIRDSIPGNARKREAGPPPPGQPSPAMPNRSGLWRRRRPATLGRTICPLEDARGGGPAGCAALRLCDNIPGANRFPKRTSWPSFRTRPGKGPQPSRMGGRHCNCTPASFR